MTVEEFESLQPGDKVQIVSEWNDRTNENPEGLMDKYLGTEMTILGRDTYVSVISMHEDRFDRCGDKGWNWNRHCIECKMEDAEFDFDESSFLNLCGISEDSQT